jgi:HAD superfamily hydrolase (TIGR01509 family)
MIKAILWDNDGVLVETEHLYFRATQETLAQIGIDLSQDLYAEYVLKQGRGPWHLAEEKGLAADEIDRMREARNTRYAKLLQQEDTAIIGARETLANLHGQFTMGLVTSSRPDHLEIIHQSTSMLKYFDFVVTSLCFTHYKPHPEPYLIGLEKTGCHQDECIVIEDSPRGLAAANAAGLRCLVIPAQLSRDDDFVGAYAKLNAITEVTPELLRSI